MRLALAALALLLAFPAAADAYIGPGAGFALISSFLVMLTTAVLAAAALVAWPFRALWRLLTRATRPKASVSRLIIIGFDGQDPVLTDRFMREGKLPNFAKLAAAGAYSRLRTTFPSVSPVAWSSFSTGTSPARHNIFDFLDRDRRTYLPMLSSASVGKVTRFLRLGRFRIPLNRPDVRLLRKSKPFWSLLGERGIWSTILRVPITFPPDRFYGAQLSAMSVPDLLGTQGTFTLFTTRAPEAAFKEGGVRVAVQEIDGRIDTAIQGPENAFREGTPPMHIPLSIRIDRRAGQVTLTIDRQVMRLEPGALSDWITVTFRAVPGVTVSGICRLLVTEVDPAFSLYMTPISIDPDRPAMPISHPSYYAAYMAARIGKYATLGLAEDTWALNEGVIDGAAFLAQTCDIDRERQAMFLAALERLREGTLVCVFDATDRVQHMFWRDMDGSTESPHRRAIEDLYTRNDAFVGTAMDRLGTNDVLMVLSDHGFTAFRRGVNLNGWLLEHGYLALKPGADGTAEWLRDVDWTRTRAYALGLTSLFMNVRGREGAGIVDRGTETTALKAELRARLSGLVDDETGDVAIRELFDTAALYEGPYLDNAPDLLVGYNSGYRISWDCAKGVVAGRIFDDNLKAWSGDHCVDPRLVPGVLFCNRRIDAADPALVDIAPTALRLFGLEPPAYMEGKPLFNAGGQDAA